ncbi:MAG TPA: hypothetical protein VN522_08705 [Solirubrobacterales bacterium]|nr:hypothetical protein [Solirubrobacterales bacterium]
MSNSDKLVHVGINVASGTTYIGVMRGTEPLVDDGADRIRPNAQLDHAARFEDFRARLGQELRRLQPRVVGIARTRKYGNWTMANASTRFGLEAVAMIAAEQEGLECRLITQEEAAKSVEVPIPRLSEALPKRLGMEQTPHWNDRAVAFLVAAHLALGSS